MGSEQGDDVVILSFSLNRSQGLWLDKRCRALSCAFRGNMRETRVDPSLHVERGETPTQVAVVTRPAGEGGGKSSPVTC